MSRLDSSQVTLYSTLAAILFVTSSLAQSTCPVADIAECECVNSFNVYNYVICDGYNGEHLPVFRSSNTTFTSVTFLRSRVRHIRRADLDNVRAQSLHMNALGIESIEEKAFEGLGDILQELYLGSNNLTSLTGKNLHHVLAGTFQSIESQ